MTQIDAGANKEATEMILQTWIASVGLRFHPFRPLDAGSDPRLPTYLVGHKAFEAIWGDWPAFVFAPAGGGKTAFRVRLARACRVGQDGRRVLPVIYQVPSPAKLGGGLPTLEAHVGALTQPFASEILLALAYQPDRFHALPIGEQRAVRQVLDWNLPGSLNHFLDQLDTFADLSPLVEAFDPTAEGLPASPAPADIHKFCSALRQLPTAPPERPPIQERLQSLLEFVLGPLRFQAVYLLVDGVDAHAETVSEPKAALLLLRPLLEQIHPWAQRRLFLKCFLPVELQPLIRSVKPNILTKDVKAVTIIWSHETLVQILRERLRVASEGMFDSFDAICIPALRDVEADLVRTAKPLPREVLVLAQRLFWEHVRHAGPAGRLEPVDLDHALAWYATTPVL